MSSTIRITYLDHSGFAVQMPDALLIFDDARGPAPQGTSLDQGWITREQVAQSPRTYVFVSHSHADHFDASIFDWAEPSRVQYILSTDVPAQWKGRRMAPGDVLQLDDYTITAHASTDLGVSYLVRHPACTLFHAG
ncbi:MAG: hypothetical protein RR482_03695, partial [Clostridia bacterium]